MKSFLRTLCAVLLANLIVLLILAGAIGGKMKTQVEVKDGSVLVQDLNGEIPEFSSIGGISFGNEAATHTAILENLEKARVDKRIKAVILKIGSPGLGWAKMDELFLRIGQIRSAGKPVYAYTDILQRGALYLGSACDSLFLLRTGYVSLHGFSAPHPFIKGTLDKLGIKDDLHKIEKYKSAAEIIQRQDMSPEARANVEWMLDSYYPEYINRVEAARKLPPGTMESKIMAQPALNPQDVLQAGLVDRLVFWDEVESSALKVAGVKPRKKEGKSAPDRPNEISGADYAKVTRAQAGIKGKKTIAVVHAVGAIQGEESGVSFPFGVSMGSTTMAEAFRAAAENKDAAAIIFRVDSGGGESHTSWKIQRAALQAGAEKPMVVSMCDVAGSGGYMICYPCGTLVADRLSVVGSIGSISGKFNMRGFYDKIGMTWDFVTRGPNALMESEYFDYTPEQFEAFKAKHWADYYYWVDDIARVRHKTSAEIDSVGRGRVWTGEQALARGLIDTLGTFDDALAIAKRLAKIPAGEEVKLVHYPKKPGVLESLKRGGFAMALSALWEQVFGPISRPVSWAVDWNSYR